MGNIRCKGCKELILADQNKCPLCGKSTRSLLEWFSEIFIEAFKFFSYFFVIFVIFVVFAYFWSRSDSYKEYKQKTEVVYQPSASIPAKIDAPVWKTKKEFMKDAEIYCRYDHTKRGVLDSRMYEYCLSTQREWTDKILHLNSTHKEGSYVDYAYPYCYADGTKRGISNPTLVLFCLELEVDAVEDILYYSNKFGRDRVFNIVNRSMSEKPSWNSARYKVKDLLNPGP